MSQKLISNWDFDFVELSLSCRLSKLNQCLALKTFQRDICILVEELFKVKKSTSSECSWHLSNNTKKCIGFWINEVANFGCTLFGDFKMLIFWYNFDFLFENFHPLLGALTGFGTIRISSKQFSCNQFRSCICNCLKVNQDLVEDCVTKFN